MFRDALLSALMAVIVIGSVFGAGHIRRLYRWMRHHSHHGSVLR
ncbi:MAG TPA: hypothetical protein VG714_08920 [Acidobacteriaceae bacterium]|nr:hypothetical protein [Acidobacteriaceae bacterium]